MMGGYHLMIHVPIMKATTLGQYSDKFFLPYHMSCSSVVINDPLPAHSMYCACLTNDSIIGAKPHMELCLYVMYDRSYTQDLMLLITYQLITCACSGYTCKISSFCPLTLATTLTSTI